MYKEQDMNSQLKVRRSLTLLQNPFINQNHAPPVGSYILDKSFKNHWRNKRFWIIFHPSSPM